jgi:hypothetical protein
MSEAKTKEGVQDAPKDTSANENHGSDATTGLGGTASGAGAPSQEQLHNGMYLSGNAHWLIIEDKKQGPSSK